MMGSSWSSSGGDDDEAWATATDGDDEMSGSGGGDQEPLVAMEVAPVDEAGSATNGGERLIRRIVLPAGEESSSSSASSSASEVEELLELGEVEVVPETDEDMGEDDDQAEGGGEAAGASHGYNLRRRSQGAGSSGQSRRTSGRSALQQILALMVGRDQRSDTSDNSSDEGSDLGVSFWPPVHRARKNKKVTPDEKLVQGLDKSDFSLLTRMRLQSLVPVCPTAAVAIRAIQEGDCSGKAASKCLIKSLFKCDKTKCSGKSKTASPKAVEASPPSPSLMRPSPFVSSALPPNTSARGLRRGMPVAAMVANREIGRFRRHGTFSFGNKCLLMDKFLPNSGKQLARFRQKIFCGTYSSCGGIFMSACQDQNIRIYDTSSGNFKQIKCIQARDVGWSVLDTALSPDGHHIIYSSWCDYIHQVNVSGEEERHVALPLSPDDGRFCLFSLRFSCDGLEILGGSNDRHIYLYDRVYGTESLKIPAHDDDVNAVAFADTTTHILASGGDDGVCKIWDRRSLRESNPQPVGVFAGHVDGITYIDPRGDGRHLITNSKDQSVKLWDLRNFSPEDAVEEAKYAVGNQNWDYRWQGVPSSMNRCQQRPTIRHDSSVMTYRGHTVLQTLIRCRFSPMHSTGQRYIYSGCATGSVVVYDALTGDMVLENKGHASCVRDVSWHPYNNEIISTSWDYSHVRWRFQESEVKEEAAASVGKKSGDCAAGTKRSKADSDDEDEHDGRERRTIRRLMHMF